MRIYFVTGYNLWTYKRINGMKYKKKNFYMYFKKN